MRRQHDLATNRHQKEWQDHYSATKQDSDELKKEIRHLNYENEKLLKQLEALKMMGTSNQPSSMTEGEAKRRLHKRELECQALWETLKDLQIEGHYDIRHVMDVLAKRALDTKARRKLQV